MQNLAAELGVRFATGAWRRRLLAAAAAAVIGGGAAAAVPARLTIPDYGALAAKASQSVNITLDSPLLALAARFLNSDDPEDAATLDIIKGLQGIYVRSFTFDQEHAFEPADLEPVRKQLSAPGWNLLVQTRSRKTHDEVDIYLMTQGGQAVGLALIDSEPRQFTIVNIVGSIDLQKLHALEGRFGVPKLDGDPASAVPRK